MNRKPVAAILAATVLTGGLLFGVSQQVPAYTSEECRPGSGGQVPYPYCQTPAWAWWQREYLPMVKK